VPIRRDLEIAGGIDAYTSFVGGDAALAGTRVVVTGQFEGPAVEAFGQELMAIGDDLGIDVVYRSAFFDPGGPQAIALGDDPGDILIFGQPAAIAELVAKRPIVDIGAYIGDQYMRESYGDYLTSLGSLNGHTFGVFVTLGAKSLIWYNRDVFEASGYVEPSTWQELVELSDQMVLDGQTPWCLGVAYPGAPGWPATDWLEAIVLRSEGAEIYDRWAHHEIPFNHSALIAALEQLGELAHTPDYVSPDPGIIDQRTIGESVFLASQEDPQCLLLPAPDWVEGFFSAGAAMVATPFPTIDPDFESSIVGGGDVAIAVSDRPEVRAVMRGLASASYGVSLVQREDSGFIPPHRGFDLSVYTDPVRGSIATAIRNAMEDDVYRFDASDQMPEQVALSLHEALSNYLTDPGASAGAALSSVEDVWTEYEANSTGG
jgi:alpha-glucoside transport system substrate-binding protein